MALDTTVLDVYIGRLGAGLGLARSARDLAVRTLASYDLESFAAATTLSDAIRTAVSSSIAVSSPRRRAALTCCRSASLAFAAGAAAFAAASVLAIADSRRVRPASNTASS